MNGTDITDEQLVRQIRSESCQNRTNLLIKRYIPMVSAKAAKTALRCPSAECDDLFSEGLLGLLKAIRCFDEDKGAPFGAFASLCVDCAMKNCVAKALKANPLSRTEDFDFSAVSDDSPLTEDYIVEKENEQQLIKKLAETLSKRELRIFELYIRRFSYQQIAHELDISEKSVDNALCRAKTKLRKLLGK